MVLSHCDTASGLGGHFVFGRMSCTKFPHGMSDSLGMVNCDCQFSVYYASRAARIDLHQRTDTNIADLPANLGEGVLGSSQLYFEILIEYTWFQDSPEYTSLPGFCLSLGAATTVVVSHQGFYAAAEPYPALRRVHIANEHHSLPILLSSPKRSNACSYRNAQYYEETGRCPLRSDKLSALNGHAFTSRTSVPFYSMHFACCCRRSRTKVTDPCTRGGSVYQVRPGSCMAATDG